MSDVKQLSLDGAGKSTRMYHVMYDLEPRFSSLQQALEFTENLKFISPRVPHTHGMEEETVTPRVCVAPTLELCITAIGAGGRFRRCIETRYNNEREVYPVIVCEVEGNFEKPPTKDVPDVEFTKELWSRSVVRVKQAELRWLGSDSLKIAYMGAGELVCRIDWVWDPSGYLHPWLTEGQGHPLDCSLKGGEAWPPIELVWDSLYLETFVGQQLVFMVPQIPPSGYCLCSPVEGGEAYRARLTNCRKFTGFFDSQEKPLFCDDFCSVRGRVGNIQFVDGAWVFKVANEIFPFSQLDKSNVHVFAEVQSLEHWSFESPDWFHPR